MEAVVDRALLLTPHCQNLRLLCAKQVAALLNCFVVQQVIASRRTDVAITVVATGVGPVVALAVRNYVAYHIGIMVSHLTVLILMDDVTLHRQPQPGPQKRTDS